MTSDPRAARVVLFDLDGTLLDHEGAARAAVTAWLRERGAPADETLVTAWFDAESRHVAAWQRGELDWTGQRRARVRELLARIGEPVDDERALDAAFASYLARYERSWRAFPDVEDALRAITARGLRTAVLTNGADAQQRAKLAAIGLADRVGPVFSADVIGAAKPAAAAFHHACEALGVAPGAVVSVGDRHDLDVVAASAAGLQAVHLDRPGDGPRDEPCRIRTLSELGALLDGH